MPVEGTGNRPSGHARSCRPQFPFDRIDGDAQPLMRILALRLEVKRRRRRSDEQDERSEPDEEDRRPDQRSPA